MSDRKLTPNFRRLNFATTSLSLQSTVENYGQEEGEEDYPLFKANRFQAKRMQSSFDLPIGDSGSRELLQDDELMTTTSRMVSVDEPDEEEEALDNFEMGTPNESRNDLEILSPIKLSMLSTQLLSTTSGTTTTKTPRNKSTNSNALIIMASSLKGGQRGGGSGATMASDNSGRDRRVADEGQRPRKVVEFANFDDYSGQKQNRTDSTGDAAIQAKIFAEIKK